jgi:hypothetical protein
VDGTTYAAYDAETANVAPIITSKAQPAQSWVASFAVVYTRASLQLPAPAHVVVVGTDTPRHYWVVRPPA